jgi:hypothetical protein
MILAVPPLAATETAPALPETTVICCLPDQDCLVPLGSTDSAFTTPSTVTCTQALSVSCISTLTGALVAADGPGDGLLSELGDGLRGLAVDGTAGEIDGEATIDGEIKEGETEGAAGIDGDGCLGKTSAESG